MRSFLRAHYKSLGLQVTILYYGRLIGFSSRISRAKLRSLSLEHFYYSIII